MVTEGTENVSSAGATLQGSFSGATGTIVETGFYWGTSASDLNRELYVDSASGSSGSFSATLESLNANTTYYYKAYVLEETDGSYEYHYGEVKSFKTSASGSSQTWPQWLELPSQQSDGNFYDGHFGKGTSRNYSYHYDRSTYTALWTAYPLTSSHTSGSATSKSWAYNPDFSADEQINVKSNSYSSNYGGNYSRGHQLPAADRKCDATMRKQVYYLTNQTPQLQDGFNGTVWSTLENTVRGLTNKADTVYVVTGAAFRKVGGSESITYLNASSSSIKPSKIPVPNYYWKVLLKVKRSGGSVTSASAVGVWMEHKNYSDSNAWQDYVVSVKQIQDWTGFNFFDALPDGIEASAESNTSWSTFSSF